MFNIALFSLSFVFLGLSYLKSPLKTKKALKIAWNSFVRIMPMMLGVIGLIGIMLTLMSPETIGLVFNNKSWWSTSLAALIGSITLIPAFIAFPLAASLLREGAGVMPIAAFVTTLTMVGIITAPMEISIFGHRYTLLRNALSFATAIVIAYIMALILVQ
ncbi:permease [Paradesulfitobacterium aromaticivorans]